MFNRRLKIKLFALLFIVVASLILWQLLHPILSVRSAMRDVHSDVNSEVNVFSNVSFKETISGGRDLAISAESVQENDLNNFVLNKAISTLTFANGEEVSIRANVTNVSRDKNKESELSGDVLLTMKSGLQLKTQQAIVDFNDNVVSGRSRVDIAYHDIQLNGEQYNFDINNRTLQLAGKTYGKFSAGQVNADKLVISFSNGNNASVKSIEAIGDTSLHYQADQKQYDIKSDHLLAYMDEHGKVNEVVSSKPLTVKTSTAIIHANSGKLKKHIVNVNGNVEILSDHGNIFGSAATLNMETGEISVRQSSGIVNDGKR